MKDPNGELWLQTHIMIALSYNIIVHTLQARTYIVIWSTTMHNNKTHITYDFTTPQTMTLLQTIHCFIRTNLADYAHCSAFPITVDTTNIFILILKLIRSTIVLFDKLREYVYSGILQ